MMLHQIRVYKTLSPHVLEFVLDKCVLPVNDKCLVFNSKNECNNAPLVAQLLDLEGIASVICSNSCIAVYKHLEYEWKELKLQVSRIIDENLKLDLSPFISEANKSHDRFNKTNSNDNISQRIYAVISTVIRRALAADGGDIDFVSYENGVVSVMLRGACQGCPRAAFTLKNGIENVLKQYIPEVQSVVHANIED